MAVCSAPSAAATRPHTAQQNPISAKSPATVLGVLPCTPQAAGLRARSHATGVKQGAFCWPSGPPSPGGCHVTAVQESLQGLYSCGDYVSPKWANCLSCAPTQHRSLSQPFLRKQEKTSLQT